MKHRNSHKRLSRDTSHRKSLMRNFLGSLFKYGYITTTKPKAKVAKTYIAKFITKLLKSDDRNYHKVINQHIYTANRAATTNAIKFYQARVGEERLSNYIGHKITNQTLRNSDSKMIIYFL